jgi:subtilase family serine protease
LVILSLVCSVLLIRYGQVVSISWATCDTSITNMVATEQQALLLAAHGVTLIAASGDNGVMGGGYVCNSPCGPYPAVSQWVTSVGATMLSPLASPICTAAGLLGTCPTSSPREVVCSSCAGSAITSGGGFSPVIAAPTYMRAAQNSYLSQVAQPFDGLSGRRGYPDVAMLGHNFPVVVDGVMTAEGMRSPDPDSIWALTCVRTGQMEQVQVRLCLPR